MVHNKTYYTPTKNIPASGQPHPTFLGPWQGLAPAAQPAPIYPGEVLIHTFIYLSPLNPLCLLKSPILFFTLPLIIKSIFTFVIFLSLGTLTSGLSLNKTQ